MLRPFLYQVVWDVVVDGDNLEVAFDGVVFGVALPAPRHIRCTCVMGDLLIVIVCLVVRGSHSDVRRDSHMGVVVRCVIVTEWCCGTHN